MVTVRVVGGLIANPTTRNSQLATRNPQLATRNPQRHLIAHRSAVISIPEHWWGEFNTL